MTEPQKTGAFLAMVDQGVPADRAIAKVQSTRRGWLFLVAGACCIAAAFGFVIYTMTITKGAPAVSTMIFALLPGVPGMYFLLAGGHLISGDAMRAAEDSGNVLARTAAKALKIARGNVP